MVYVYVAREMIKQVWWPTSEDSSPLKRNERLAHPSTSFGIVQTICSVLYQRVKRRHGVLIFSLMQVLLECSVLDSQKDAVTMIGGDKSWQEVRTFCKEAVPQKKSAELEHGNNYWLHYEPKMARRRFSHVVFRHQSGTRLSKEGLLLVNRYCYWDH
ncbi:hypothetical protein EVAR_29170_1 [Eumeta japonica]|uniref:Uncharacterized protein n=1 Tax=Eumeta variegata TaxID=151549 RepID=A0A4C1VBY6_EUMVA|nr:hypothetical protein EVAR_29170_1 [Eumeta japonica]